MRPMVINQSSGNHTKPTTLVAVVVAFDGIFFWQGARTRRLVVRGLVAMGTTT